MAALGSAVATLQQAAQEQPLGSCYDMAVETLALACYAATQLARQVEALCLGFWSATPPGSQPDSDVVICGMHMIMVPEQRTKGS